jgi:hypothetical protein
LLKLKHHKITAMFVTLLYVNYGFWSLQEEIGGTADEAPHANW